jgi:hypothetical protein
MRAWVCEFDGRGFLRWLGQNRIHFVIRLRGNVKMANRQGEMRTARGLFWHFPSGESRDLGWRSVFGGKQHLCLFVSGMRARDGDFVIVVSSRAGTKAGEPLEWYRNRWGIETLFGCLKRRGFDLEGTHLTRPERLSRLMAVLTLAYSWAYVTGAWLFEQVPWTVKTHGRLAVSLFRRGLDWLQQALMPLCGKSTRRDCPTLALFLSST